MPGDDQQQQQNTTTQQGTPEQGNPQPSTSGQGGSAWGLRMPDRGPEHLIQKGGTGPSETKIIQRDQGGE